MRNRSRRSLRARGAALRHSREWGLAYVLCAIIILNIIAIAILSNRLEEERVATQTPPPTPSLIEHRPLVRAVILEDTARCPDCFDIRSYVTALDDAINLEIEEGDWELWSGRVRADSRMLTNAQRLPAIAFNATIEEYPQLVTDWDTVGYTITFGSGPYEGAWYVLPTLNPPYLDAATGEVGGRVQATYLMVNSCTECVTQADYRAFLNESRIVPFTETVVDSNSQTGRALIERYNITKAPTLLLSPEALDYPGFAPGWSVVGSEESDGTLILRDLERLELVHVDLSTGRVMKP